VAIKVGNIATLRVSCTESVAEGVEEAKEIIVEAI